VSSVSQPNSFGRVEGNKFIVDKWPEHFLRVQQSFGCNEKRLGAMASRGVVDCLILFHTLRDSDLVVCYRTSLKKWLSGPLWLCDRERQRLIRIEDCEKA